MKLSKEKDGYVNVAAKKQSRLKHPEGSLAVEHPFPNLEKAARRLGSRPQDLSLPRLRDLLCRDCDFYHEDHEDELECSCFRMLRLVLERGVLTPAQLSDAAGSEDRPPE